MTSSQHRALIFGDAAATYDAARPDYPIEAIDHVLGLTGVRRALEVGAGTGKATARFARPGLGITCLEPSPAMAAVLIGRGLPAVDVEVVAFEEWNGSGSSVDLVYAAQSWHWLEHSTAYERANRLLRKGGALALIWNVEQDRYARFAAVYRVHGPEILEESAGSKDQSWLAHLEAAGFREPHVFTHRWAIEHTASSYRRLLSTYSDHMMIPEPRRSRLLDELESAVTNVGGSVTVEYETRVFAGLK